MKYSWQLIPPLLVFSTTTTGDCFVTLTIIKSKGVNMKFEFSPYVAVQVKDYDKAIDFYKRVMGMEFACLLQAG